MLRRVPQVGHVGNSDAESEVAGEKKKGGKSSRACFPGKLFRTKERDVFKRTLVKAEELYIIDRQCHEIPYQILTKIKSMCSCTGGNWIFT